LSESSHTARRRHEYMPNRMFDPVANPFAVQNLLVEESQPFTVATDERSEFRFESDPLISGQDTGAFALDEVIELADLTGATAFAAEARAAGGFVAQPSTAPADINIAAQENTFTADAAMAAQSADAFTEQTEHDQTIAAAQQADDMVTPSGDAEDAVAASLPEAEVLAAAPDPDEASSADAEEPIAIGTDAHESEAKAAEPEQASASATLSSAPVTPDLSGEAVTALVEAAREEARAEARETAYNEGLEAGRAQAREELQKEHDAQITQLKALQEALQKLSFDADALFEPVKKLTVHLAEQLVRGELAQSPQTISRLVDNSLRELNASGEKAVIVHLNHEDLESYRPLVAQFGDSMILRPDSLLERGSVRVSLDGSVVEDLMQRRIDGLKKSLSQPAAPGWQAGGGRLSDRLNESQRGSQHVEDVTAVVTSSSDDDNND
jgi:flagellar biosynthesis/type III secretory pathway protein FliH